MDETEVIKEWVNKGISETEGKLRQDHSDFTDAIDNLI